MLKRMSEHKISRQNRKKEKITPCIINVDWSRKINKTQTATHSTQHSKNSTMYNNFIYNKDFNYRVANKNKTKTYNKSNKIAPYKFIYGTFFLIFFGILFFYTVNISSASNLVPKTEKEYNDYVSFEEYPEKHLEELIFGDEKNNENKTNIKNNVLKSKKIEYNNYRVKTKETLEVVAKKFGLKLDTIILCNNIKKKRQINAGEILNIPNQDGREIKVARNDSIYKIAKRYGIEWEDIADINNLQSEKLFIGQSLFIPKSEMTSYEKEQYFGDYFIWPANSNVITSFFGPRKDPINGNDSFHSGLDIRGSMGDPVYVSKDGKIINIGKSKVFGNYIEVKHSNNMITKYAHLSKVTVKKNAEVSQGEKIGEIGNTGRSTGSHLHFEIRKNGKLIDPLKLVKN